MYLLVDQYEWSMSDSCTPSAIESGKDFYLCISMYNFSNTCTLSATIGEKNKNRIIFIGTCANNTSQ